MLEVIKNRRLIRRYINKYVEEEKILKILKAVMQSSSSKYSSPWEFIEINLNNGYQYE